MRYVRLQRSSMVQISTLAENDSEVLHGDGEFEGVDISAPTNQLPNKLYNSTSRSPSTPMSGPSNATSTPRTTTIRPTANESNVGYMSFSLPVYSSMKDS